MDYSELIAAIKRYYPNYYRRHYKQYIESGSLWSRMNIAEGLANEVHEYFTDMQQDGYKADMPPRPVQLPPKQSGQSIELLTDYVLANYHERGLALKRESDGLSRIDEEYPPLGEGAREYLERCFIGVPINPAERRLLKRCEVCEGLFIDNSRAKNAKVCGNSCRARKDVLRKRLEYNKSELGLRKEKRLKRYRERQDLEYPFYSPQEMHELASRSECVAEDKRIDNIAYKNDEEYDGVRFDGKRKPMYVGRDEFDKKPFSYRPSGRENKKEPAVKWGEVVVRKIGQYTAEELEAEKFVDAEKAKGLHWLDPCRSEALAEYTSEKHAI